MVISNVSEVRSDLDWFLEGAIAQGKASGDINKGRK